MWPRSKRSSPSTLSPRRARCQHAADQIEHGGAVWATVAEVAYKDQAAPLRVIAFMVVAQMSQQLFQREVFTVDIAHDVEGAGGQGLDKAHDEGLG